MDAHGWIGEWDAIVPTNVGLMDDVDYCGMDLGLKPAHSISWIGNVHIAWDRMDLAVF